MSIEKHLNPRAYLKNHLQNQNSQYRVRPLSRNHSMKQLSSKIKLQIPLNIIKNQHETSFFIKQNSNLLQIKSEQDLPKYSINSKKQKPTTLKRNSSHRILRKINSQQLIVSEQNKQKVQPIKYTKQIFCRQQILEDLSLKKKVDFIRKKHFEDKKQLFSTPSTIPIYQSQTTLGQRKKSKPKLKIMVRDPFTQKNKEKLNQPKNKQCKITQINVSLMTQSIIQLNNQTMISQDNRNQFQEFLSCIN